MANTFLISDTHFGHAGVTKFLREDGTKLRPWDSVEEMDEALVKNWNKIVNPKDKVYHLGDVVINRRALPVLERLNGDKILVKGNHDIFCSEEYLAYFKDIRAYQVIDKVICSHVPIHPSQLSRFTANIHGHLHSNIVYRMDKLVDERYINVCVEQINYTPIALEDVLNKIKPE